MTDAVKMQLHRIKELEEKCQDLVKENMQLLYQNTSLVDIVNRLTCTEVGRYTPDEVIAVFNYLYENKD